MPLASRRHGSMSRLRLILVLLALLGCTSAPQPPAPAPVPAAPVAEPQRTAARVDTFKVCILHRGKLIDARVELQPTGDTTVGGRPFSEVYGDTGQYALTREWYVNNETIDYDPESICFMKYGLPRLMERDSLVRLGEWRGVPVFRESSDDPRSPMVVYVPVRAGCEFHPYQTEASAPPPACPQPPYRFSVP
ncbi:MAG TPA: hypothetical protein VEQ60_11085 [Longimicrobium sp.]|nr:hypothetical protein [Longimicrobium sp.]